MAEYSVPANFRIPDDANLTDAVFGNASDFPDSVSFDRKVNGKWEPVTAKHFAEEVKALAAGLIAAGVEPGDRVALMSATRYEWTLIDYAIWTAGAVTVPIYETSSAEQVQWILTDSGAVAFFYETDAHQAAFAEVDAPAVKNAWQIGDDTLEKLTAQGKNIGEDDIEQRRRTLTPESLATIIYTSGTTGRPKGCELTHRNFLYDATATTEGLDELFGPDQSTLLFLPLAHVFARIIQVGCVQNRARMGHTADIKNLMADLAVFKPTFILSVPRVFEKVYNTAKQRAHADGKGAIFDLAEKVAIAYSEATDAANPAKRLALEVPHRAFDALVYSKLRAALGGRAHSAISGGAPLGARLGHFFRGIGLPIYEGYGLTETTAGATCNRPDAMKVGTVGRPIPGVTIRIADDGEILMKGDNVFKGYYQNPDATKETLEGGWFHTGDIGELDKDGYLRITGRKKELIVTAGGKNVAPAVLEDRLRANPLISQCMVVGDQKPFIACLVTIDEEAFPDWKSKHNKPKDASVKDLVDDDDLRGAVQSAIDDANKAVSHAEAIKAFRILPEDWSVESGHLTPSLKVKRNVVLKDHASDVDALYSKPKAG